MKRHRHVLSGGCLATFTACLSLAAASPATAQTTTTTTTTQTSPLLRGGPPFSDQFGRYDSTRWYISHGWRVGNWMINDWRRSQSIFNNGLALVFIKNKTTLADYSSGEVQSLKTYGHGYYQVRMRAARGSGVVTGFFTYTGPQYKTEWDEIDVEIIGTRPRQVQFTYFRNGKKLYYVHNLGFDATAASHLYGFNWQPGGLGFYVDDKMVYRFDGSRLPLPKLKQRIMFSLWGSQTMNTWLGAFKPELIPTAAMIDCVSYSYSFKDRPACP